MSTVTLKKRIRRWATPVFILISGVILSAVGVPRFLYELMLVPGTPILHRVNAGKEVLAEELEILEKSRLDALEFMALPGAYYDLGAIYLRRAQTASRREDIRKYSEMALEASMNGLDMAPFNTFAWTRAVVANVMLGPENNQEALRAWRRSIAVARYEPFILMHRVHIGIILFQEMTEEDAEALKDQLSLAYRWDKWQLRQYIRTNKLVAWMTILCEPDSEMKAYLVS